MKALALAVVSFLFLASCGSDTVAAAPGDVKAPAAVQKEGGCCSEDKADACCDHGAAKTEKAEKKGCCGACAPASKPKGDEKQ